ncbi:hypothetical protein C2R22_08660 [Salinigranum rubrum]|uniref:Uncharacterized protein n=1 Tax=Salinigranum rubrum TaxID=755307 RepID=A0A2I8VIH1_9EURY|nr:DUF6517 family protein [Salinigranum rubrum]AUV81711.1 hypothetical protein C2R22_08660 [Salinigranum rubrum]
MTDEDPPAPRVDVPDGWVATETTTERVFSVSKVTVTATTVVYEDERLREGGDDGGEAETKSFRRFVFASRLRLRPTTKPSKPLTKLVRSRAKAGFADRLRERGMDGVEERESRRFRVRDQDATLVGYDAECTVEGTRLAVDGWVAVWPRDDGDYVVAGGAYPTRVLDGGGVEGGNETLEPGRYRDDLFSIIREIN